MRTLSSAAVRGLIAGALPIFAVWLLDQQLGSDQGPDIGGGLVMLVALVVIPFLWARRDGAALGMWCASAVVPWLADALRVYVDNDGHAVTDALESLVAALFLVFFFLGGAVIGAVVGAPRHSRLPRQSGGQA